MLEQPVDIVILTEDRYLHPNLNDWYQAQIAQEEGLVVAALAKLGLSVARRSWSDPSMDWSQCGAAVFRSTWDYFERFSEFEPWLEQVSQHTRLINDAELIRWNIDKRYLLIWSGPGWRSSPRTFWHAHKRRRWPTSCRSVAGTRWCSSPWCPVQRG